MGLVYRARREDGQFDKEVAIKILYWGLHNPSLWERFGRERQVLARLEHPGITRLLDSGVSEDGQPYLVMELVEGVPITEYSKREALPLRKRTN
jgi:eukaryotic-like serine/threonine-protein kinase